METLVKHFEAIYEKAKTYTETSIELLKLNSIDAISDVMSSIVSRLIVVLTVSMFALFLSISASFYIGQQMGHYYLGFLMVSMFYLILALIVFFFKDNLIKTPIANLVIAKLTKPKKNMNVTADSDRENLEENESLQK